MSSLKMTFSLASLILILGLVFATVPAMAQIDRVLGLGPDAIDSTPANIDELGTALTIPAKGHLVIYKATDLATSGLPATLTATNSVQWADMPNLEELFFGNAGGTIALMASKTAMSTATPPAVIAPDFRYDHDGDDDGSATLGAGAHASAVADDGIIDSADLGATPTPTATTHPATADADVQDAGYAAITEIMWGLDNTVAGQATVDDRQWIEIYNPRNVPLPTNGLVLHIKSGRPGSSAISKDDVATVLDTAGTAVETQGRTVLDWFSNVDGNGWQNPPPGQNGAHNTDADLRIDFVSMYRNRGKLGKTEGTNLGHWSASTNVYLPGYKGTPGAAERTGPKRFTASGVSLDVVFNEVANHSNADYEWFELYNPDGELPHLENWRIHIVTAVDTQKEFLTFPKLNDGRYGNLLLVTKTDPADDDEHPLALGYNVAKDDNGQLPGHDPTIRYYVAGDRWKEAMPDGEFILILRNGNDKTNHEKVVDVAGYHSNLRKSTADFESSQWPLLGHGAPANKDGRNNKLENKTVHRRQHTGIIGTGTSHGDTKVEHLAMRDVGWTGIGYKRNATANAENGGTPGYPNDALKGVNNADAVAAIQITEVMAVAGDRSLPEWIEIQNVSNPIGVNLDGWRVLITNHDTDGADGSFAGKLTYTINIGGRLPAGQNFLIVARRGRDETQLPNERVHNVNLKRNEPMLNPYGFQVTIEANEKTDRSAKYHVVDTVGNLSPKPEDSRRDDAQSFLPIVWELPMQMNEDGDRISLVRIADVGTQKGALIRYDMSNQIDNILDETDYGHESDIGSPGHHPGGVLPVSLSKFRPERMKDTGAVVIRWITESELNNAGFNILRSETRDGEFTKINTALIAGQGTTTERTTYEYADTSAKPNVVYYYQIQDVSLDGQVTTLRTTHLRGNVTAAGKLTTTWGELKALQ